VDFLDHDDDAAGPLAAPGLVDDRGLEGHAGEPGAVLARLLVAQVVRPDEVLRRAVRVAAVAELQVGREGGEELAGRDAHSLGPAQVAQIHLAERVALFVAHAARHVAAEEHLGGIVDGVDSVHEHEEPLALGKDDQLRPARAGLAARGGIFVLVSRLDCHEVLGADDRRLHGLHAVAELRALDHALAAAAAVGHEGVVSRLRVGLVLVPGIAAHAVPVRGLDLVGVGRVAAGLHEPVDDHQPVADLAEAGGLVEKRLLFDAGHPVLGVFLGDDGFELVGLDLDAGVALSDAGPVGAFGRLGRRRNGGDGDE